MTAAEFPVAVTYLLVAAVVLGVACRGVWRVLGAARTFLRPAPPLSPALEARINAAATAEDAAVQRARTILKERA